MPLTKEQALLIAAQAMEIFAAEKLLAKDPSGKVVVTAAAPGVKIDLLLKDLDSDDQTYGLHAIRFILLTLKENCAALGYKNLYMTSANLLDDTLIGTVDDLAVQVGMC